MATQITEDMIEELFDVISKVENKEQCRYLFDDLCTYKEILKMAQRLRAAKLLSEGKTYVGVMEETEISSATLSRVSACLQRGKGYREIYKKNIDASKKG